MDSRLKAIADHYDLEPQSRQLIEEMAELTVAINKHWRALRKENMTVADCLQLEHLEDRIVEEIADVEIMLEQMKYLMRCEDSIEKVKELKIIRQIERIEKERVQNEQSNLNG